MQEMRVYLLNNTKPYREGDKEYSGAWFNCPVDFEEVREKIGVEHEEQIEIADYELPFDLHSDMPLWEINANCRMVLELEGTPIGNEMKAIQQKWFSSFDEFIDHKDEIRYYDVGDGAALAGARDARKHHGRNLGRKAPVVHLHESAAADALRRHGGRRRHGPDERRRNGGVPK